MDSFVHTHSFSFYIFLSFSMEVLLSVSCFSFAHHTSLCCRYTRTLSLLLGSSTRSFATQRATLVGKVHQRKIGLARWNGVYTFDDWVALAVCGVMELRGVVDELVAGVAEELWAMRNTKI